MMKMQVRHGGLLRSRMNSDLGSGLGLIGIHGMQAHGLHQTRAGRAMKDVLGRGKTEVVVEANALRLGGSVKIENINIDTDTGTSPWPPSRASSTASSTPAGG